MPPIVPCDACLNIDIDTAKAKEIVSRLLLDESEAKDNLLQAKVQQLFYSNMYRGTEIVYNKVMLSTMNHRTQFKKKNEKRAAIFFPCWDGPYTVLKTHLEASTYMLDIPNQPNIFDVFHAAELKLFVANNLVLFPSCEHT